MARGGDRDGRQLVAAGVAALGVVTLLLVVYAAGAGSVRPVSESTAVRSIEPFTPPPNTPTPTPSGAPPGFGQESGSPLFGWLADVFQVLLFAGVMLVAFLLVRALIRWLLSVIREIRLPQAEETDAAAWQSVVREELSEAVTSGFERIDSGTPSDAIVACWLALEDAAAAAGVARAVSETPAEFTVRVLAVQWVSRAALERLADLYREARFSTHGLPESARAEARAALRLLRAELAPAPEA